MAMKDIHEPVGRDRPRNAPGEPIRRLSKLEKMQRRAADARDFFRDQVIRASRNTERHQGQIGFFRPGGDDGAAVETAGKKRALAGAERSFFNRRAENPRDLFDRLPVSSSARRGGDVRPRPALALARSVGVDGEMRAAGKKPDALDPRFIPEDVADYKRLRHGVRVDVARHGRMGENGFQLASEHDEAGALINEQIVEPESVAREMEPALARVITGERENPVRFGQPIEPARLDKAQRRRAESARRIERGNRSIRPRQLTKVVDLAVERDEPPSVRRRRDAALRHDRQRHRPRGEPVHPHRRYRFRSRPALHRRGHVIERDVRRVCVRRSLRIGMKYAVEAGHYFSFRAFKNAAALESTNARSSASSVAT
ncbi:MAG: hypothetical protein M5R36_02105 [Deltaproteobacteria bacterium]|nr:hypothetical protein [Deltaproteobacteria bacterium]